MCPFTKEFKHQDFSTKLKISQSLIYNSGKNSIILTGCQSKVSLFILNQLTQKISTCL